MADRVPQVIRSLSLPGEATSLSEMLPAIAEELNRTITFYNTSHEGTPLDSTVPILVSGELAEAQENWQSLAGSASYTVSTLPSPMEFPEGFDPSEFMVNIGLALKEILPVKGEANFSIVNFDAIPRVHAPKARPSAGLFIPIAIAIVGAGLVFYAVTLVQSTGAQTDTLRAQLAPAQNLITEHQKEIAALKEQIGQIPEAKPIEATGEVFSTTSTNLEQERALVDDNLSQVVSLLPETTDLTEVDYGSKSVTVNGIAPNENEIFRYARALRNSGRFSTVIVSSIAEYIIEEEDEEEIKQFKFGFLLK
jgi:type IV pilus assembly protein PilM